MAASRDASRDVLVHARSPSSFSDAEIKSIAEDKAEEGISELPAQNEMSPDSSPAVAIWKRILVGNAEARQETQRGMGSRHLMMIAIGGTIGTGIFLSAGSVRPHRILFPIFLPS